MAFFDKISAAAKSAKESANTAIEIGKLNLKIKSENDSIEQFKGQIGDLLCTPYQQGEAVDPQVTALCDSIQAATQEIQEWSGKGRHATTSRELVMLPCGAMVIDTPGIREIGILGEEERVQAKGVATHRFRK